MTEQSLALVRDLPCSELAGLASQILAGNGPRRL